MSKRTSNTNLRTESKLMNSFILDFHNKSLFKKINGAKTTIDTKPMSYVKHDKCDRKTTNGQGAEKKNTDVARKLAEIYCQPHQQ